MNIQSKNELDALRKQHGCRYSIADLTSTVCHLFGVPEPAESGGMVIPEVADQADKLIHIQLDVRQFIPSRQFLCFQLCQERRQ